MKQLRHLLSQTFSLFPLTSIAVLLLSACTLSMEEWVETEEEKGYNDVETVTNDFYTLNYEYKENCRSLTDEIQKYIAEVEADSIIYFLDNTPSEWLPKAGGYVVANCCENFPMGLMGRVLSVDKANGLIKVVTTEAELKDCFEEFDFDFDADLFTGRPNDQEVEYLDLMEAGNTRAGADGTKEVVIRDWAMFRAIQNGELQPRNTRASLTDVYDSDVNKQETETTDIMLFQVTQDNAAGRALKNLCKKLNTIDIKVYYTTKTTMQKIVKLKDEREYTKTTSTNGIKVSALMGVDLTKAKTQDKKVETMLKVSKWLRDRNSFPKVSQKLDKVWAGEDDMSIVIEIPIPNCPFGVIIRLKPVLDVSFGIYGDVEAIFWTSKNTTTTDVRKGKKVTDKNEKQDPPANEFSFNAFGQFHAAGGGELFIGLGKKLGKKAAGIGAFLEMTLNLDLNITSPTIGAYCLGTADEAFSITGKGKVGGKILTAGLFGDISFLVKEFKWWDGFTVSYNPRIKFGTGFPAVPDEDEKGPYIRQTISWYFTTLGMCISSWWAQSHKPILCIYESENQDLDKPIEVLYAKKFGRSDKLKKNTTYDFDYKNYYNRAIYVVPGVEGPGGAEDRTLYPAYKMVVQPDLKPNIEYDTFYDDDNKVYDYVYQDLDVPSQEIIYEGYPTTVYTFAYALPFTLRNAGTIPQYWEDWGVYNRINIEGAVQRERFKSLKNSVTTSGKYMVETKFVTSYRADETPITVESGVYYVPKGSTVKMKMNSIDAREYTFQTYKINKKDQGDVYLRYRLKMDQEGGLGYPDHYKKLKNKFEF